MLNFNFYSPTNFVFGKDTESQVGELVKKEKAKKVLIHYGSGSIKRSGLFDRVIKSLEEVNIEYVELGGVVPNPRDTLVYEGIELCREEKVDFILAVGGGSTIDSAKAIAAGVKYKGDFWDFYEKTATITKAVKIGVILTIPAAGSEGSNATVITKTDGMLKRVTYGDSIRPVFSIINPELTYTLPSYQTAAGIVDMMAHIFERYLTKTNDVLLTDRLCEATLVSIIEAAKVVMEEPTNYEARATICWAGTIAHNGSLGVGRQEDWASHRLEHELSALYDVTHGAGLAVIFPSYMRYTVNVDVQRYRRLAVKVFGIKDKPKKPLKVALAGIQALENFFKSINMPTSFEDIGAKKEDIDMLVKKLRINCGDVVGFFKGITMEDAKNIYELACK
ncbi:iron-containing alcohol dehydrogenase [Candidatus Izemoplasma sp. B36]|uniref:iron-containing alcohol dehydrogenase n=1 Tax=Candidatus Izemoplasma sp. B36 TaxID=3242468 RepID=UPI003555DFFB